MTFRATPATSTAERCDGAGHLVPIAQVTSFPPKGGRGEETHKHCFAPPFFFSPAREGKSVPAMPLAAAYPGPMGDP